MCALLPWVMDEGFGLELKRCGALESVFGNSTVPHKPVGTPFHFRKP